MNYLFIIDPPEKLNFKKDTSIFLMKTFLKNKMEVYYTTQKNISLKSNGSITANVNRINSINENLIASDKESKSLSFFKKIFIRLDPPFNEDYLNLTYLLNHRRDRDEKIINSAEGIRNFNEKLSILQFREIIPKTIVSNDANEIKRFIKKNTKVILKPIHGMAGNGIFLVLADDPNLNVIVETMTNNQSKIIMAQEYLPAIRRGDKRILLLNGNPLPYGLMRKPNKNEVRANLAKGGQASLAKLSKSDYNIIETIKPFLVKNELSFVGIDVIGDYLTEINVTSPTGLVEIANLSNIDISKIVFDELS